jgi:hypothetical protein
MTRSSEYLKFYSCKRYTVATRLSGCFVYGTPANQEHDKFGSKYVRGFILNRNGYQLFHFHSIWGLSSCVLEDTCPCTDGKRSKDVSVVSEAQTLRLYESSWPPQPLDSNPENLHSDIRTEPLHRLPTRGWTTGSHLLLPLAILLLPNLKAKSDGPCQSSYA